MWYDSPTLQYCYPSYARDIETKEVLKITNGLPKPQVEAGEDRTNSMHFPHFLLPYSSRTITGKHSGWVTVLSIELQHEIALPLCPIKSNVLFIGLKESCS